jgi:hypothetical protein
MTVTAVRLAMAKRKHLPALMLMRMLTEKQKLPTKRRLPQEHERMLLRKLLQKSCGIGFFLCKNN